MKFDRHFVGSPLNRRDQKPFGQPLQQGVIEKVAHGGGRRPKPVGQLAAHFFPFGLICNSRDALIRPQAQILVRDVLLWDANIESEVDRGPHFRLGLFALQGRYRPLHHLAVQIKTNRVDMPVLLSPKQIPGATEFQVERSDAEPAPNALNSLSAASLRLANGVSDTSSGTSRYA